MTGIPQVKHVYENVEMYRQRMDETGVRPEDIRGVEDLHKLPFTTKDDLRDQYPYGLLAVPIWHLYISDMIFLNKYCLKYDEANMLAH